MKKLVKDVEKEFLDKFKKAATVLILHFQCQHL
jgi:hypothetical protein